MSKYCLIACAVCAAVPVVANATNVSIYGSVDTGIQIIHTKGQGTTTSMESGQSWGSRWGMRVQEDLGNGYGVKAVLESGIASDSGKIANNNDRRSRLFSRQSTLALTGPFGELGFGRMGALSSSVGTYSMWAGWADPLGTAFKDAGIQGSMYGLDRVDNTVVYQTPKLAGWQGGLMYTFDGMAYDPNFDYDTADAGNRNRVAEAAVTYFGPRWSMQAVVSQMWWENSTIFRVPMSDSTVAGLSVQYDATWAKFWVTGQYLKDAHLVGANASLFDMQPAAKGPFLHNDSGNGIDGWALAVAARVPYGNGNWYAQLQVNDLNYDYSTTRPRLEMNRYVVSGGYIYNLSKQTWLYAIASWSKGDGDWTHKRLQELQLNDTVNRTVLQIGLNMRF